VGLIAGCTAPTSPLSCVATATPVRPAQNGLETIAVRSVAGARAVGIAHFKSGNSSLVALTNAHGAAGLAYRLGAAAIANYPVKVAIQVTKGAQKGTCSTTFTPLAVSVPAAPTLAVTTAPDRSISLSWSDASAGVTGYSVTLNSDFGSILHTTFPAGSTGTTATFPGQLADACAPSSTKDHVSATVTALSRFGNSAPRTVSKEMPRSGPPDATVPSFTVVGPLQVKFNVSTSCPKIIVHDAGKDFSYQVLAANHVWTVDAPGTYQFFYYFCSDSEPIHPGFLGDCSGYGPLSAAVTLGSPVTTPVGLQGYCATVSNTIMWTWGGGVPAATAKPVDHYVLQSADGWNGGEPAADSDYVVSSAPPAGTSLSGTHQATVWSVAADGQQSPHVVASVTCS
jgi:hypothetical protein